MRRRQVLALGTAIALAGCTAPTEVGDSNGSETPSTTTGHGTPEAGVSTELQLGSVSCTSGQTGDATIEYGTETVTVRGTIIGADMCSVAHLAAVSFVEAGEFEIVVESVRKAGTDVACAQCISAVDYTVVASFDGNLPKRVVVRHRRDGNDRDVASKMR